MIQKRPGSVLTYFLKHLCNTNSVGFADTLGIELEIENAWDQEFEKMNSHGAISLKSIIEGMVRPTFYKLYTYFYLLYPSLES